MRPITFLVAVALSMPAAMRCAQAPRYPARRPGHPHAALAVLTSTPPGKRPII